MKRKKWEKGGGTFLGYTVCMIILIFLILYFIGFFLLARTTNQMENAVNMIGRKIIVCNSLEEAQQVANEKADAYMESYTSVIRKDRHTSQIYEDSIVANVEYASGSKKEWEKGNYIILTLKADIDYNLPIVSGEKKISTMLMIE